MKETDEIDQKAEVSGKRKSEQEDLHTADQVVTGTKIEKEKDEMIMELNSPVNGNTMIMNNSEMENGQANQGSFVMTDQNQPTVKKHRPSTGKIMSTMFPCFNKCLGNKNLKALEIDGNQSDGNRNKVMSNDVDNNGDLTSDQK